MNYVFKAQSFSNQVLILLRHLAEKSKFCWTVNRSVCTPWRSPQSSSPLVLAVEVFFRVALEEKMSSILIFFPCRIKFEPHPDWSSLGAQVKFSDHHPRPSPLPGGGGAFSKGHLWYQNRQVTRSTVC